jgi:AmmeMemoRadiSam system protein B
MTGIRKAAVAGKWYPASAAQLAIEVDRYLESPSPSRPLSHLTALIAPHAGLMYSGPVAGYAYRELQDRPIETAVLVGPSHFIDFEGVALYTGGGFDSPLGVAEIDTGIAADLMAVSPVVRRDTAPHAREHSLEMQLPFLRRVAPTARIVPLLMGRQTARTATELAEALAAVAEPGCCGV